MEAETCFKTPKIHSVLTVDQPKTLHYTTDLLKAFSQLLWHVM